jgi:hypothetical protein
MAVLWNYTTVLNIVFLLVALGLLLRFVRSGGLPMLKMMGGPVPATAHEHDAGQGHAATVPTA